jgi:hypothetical protein
MKEPKITKIIVDRKVADQILVKRYIQHNPKAEVVELEVTEAEKQAMFQQAAAPAKREILLTENTVRN